MGEPTTIVHMLRHGEVYNPNKILYGRLPGYRLSELGVQMAKAAALIGTGVTINQLRSAYKMLPETGDGSTLPLDAPVAVKEAVLPFSRFRTPAGKVVAEVKKKTGQSPATISRRIASLIEQGVVEKQGGGPATQYRSTGLI